MTVPGSCVEDLGTSSAQSAEEIHDVFFCFVCILDVLRAGKKKASFMVDISLNWFQGNFTERPQKNIEHQ